MTAIGLRRGFSSPGFEQGRESEHDRFVNNIIRDVSELPDRSSLAGKPGTMVVTADELSAIICARLAEALATKA
jgi:hypothetical protein